MKEDTQTAPSGDPLGSTLVETAMALRHQADLLGSVEDLVRLLARHPRFKFSSRATVDRWLKDAEAMSVDGRRHSHVHWNMREALSFVMAQTEPKPSSVLRIAVPTNVSAFPARILAMENSPNGVGRETSLEFVDHLTGAGALASLRSGKAEVAIAAEALADVRRGDTLLCSFFGLKLYGIGLELIEDIEAAKQGRLVVGYPKGSAVKAALKHWDATKKQGRWVECDPADASGIALQLVQGKLDLFVAWNPVANNVLSALTHSMSIGDPRETPMSRLSMALYVNSAPQYRRRAIELVGALNSAIQTLPSVKKRLTPELKRLLGCESAEELDRFQLRLNAPTVLKLWAEDAAR